MDISREEDEEKWHENTRQRPMKAKRTRGLLDQSFLSSKLQQSPYPFNHPGYLIGVSLHNRHHHFLDIFIFNLHFHSNSTCSLSTFSFYVPLIQPLPFSGGMYLLQVPPNTPGISHPPSPLPQERWWRWPWLAGPTSAKARCLMHY